MLEELCCILGSEPKTGGSQQLRQTLSTPAILTIIVHGWVCYSYTLTSTFERLALSAAEVGVEQLSKCSALRLCTCHGVS